MHDTGATRAPLPLSCLLSRASDVAMNEVLRDGTTKCIHDMRAFAGVRRLMRRRPHARWNERYTCSVGRPVRRGKLNFAAHNAFSGCALIKSALQFAHTAHRASRTGARRVRSTCRSRPSARLNRLCELALELDTPT